jgi:arylsulfatase A-like enzyme
MSSQPNILFLLPDQLRACELGFNGGKNIPTPNIDRLASQGVTFSNAISTCPVCTPYRAMVQTGRWPTLTGAVINSINLYSTGDCMADVFARAGYDTGYIGKWHIQAGYDPPRLENHATLPIPPTVFVPPGPARMGWQFWAVNNFSVDYIKKPFYYRDTPEKLYWPGFETDSETDLAIEYMRGRAKSGKPFFLTVAPHPPHAPWQADQAPPKNLESIPQTLYWRSNVRGQRSNHYRYYFAMAANVDDNVGRLMKFLDESGLAGNTIVVFTTDHGEMMYSHGLVDKKYPYAESVDVPLVIRWPKRIRQRSKSDALFTPLDHFPTLASLCGLRTPSVVNGLDLSAHVLNQNGPQRDEVLMMNYSSSWDFPETMTARWEWRAVRTKQHTYIRWINGAEEFYDNLADPCQVRNLFDGRNPPAVMTRLRSRLEDLLRESHDNFPPGTAYAEWFNRNRDVVRNALGPIG